MYHGAAVAHSAGVGLSQGCTAALQVGGGSKTAQVRSETRG